MLLDHHKLYASKASCDMHAQFVEAGVIVPHNSDHVAGKQTCSCCSDGFRYHMHEGVFRRCQDNGGEGTFFHQFKGNGEAMRFALGSPLSDGASECGDPDVWGRMKTGELVEVLGWSRMYDVNVRQHRLVHHWPCKAAMSRKFDFATSVDLVVRGKLRIKHQIPGLQVAIDLFCDWAKGSHTTELIKKEAYLAMIESDPTFARQYDEWCVYAEEVAQLPKFDVFERKVEKHSIETPEGRECLSPT